MSTSFKVAAVAVVVLAAGGWWLFRQDEPGNAAASRRPVERSTESASTQNTNDSPQGERSAVEEPVGSPRLDPEQTTDTSALRQTLHGTLVIFPPSPANPAEDRGAFLDQEDATIQLRALHEDGRSVARTVAVTRGQWSCELPAVSTLFVASITVGEREAWPLEPLVESLGFDEPLTIRARFPALLELSAVDAHDRHLLHDLTAVFDPWGPPTPPQSIDPHLRVLENARSPAPLHPIVVESENEAAVTWFEWLWVRSPGYAWTRIRVDFQNEREPIVVELEPAAELEVVVSGLPNSIGEHPGDRGAGRPLPLRLVVGPLDTEWPLVARALDEPHFLFKDLPPRHVEVAIKTVHSVASRSQVLARTELQLQPGTRQAAHLTLNDLPHWPELCSLSGTLEVSDEWPAEFSLGLELIAPAHFEDVHDRVGLHERTSQLFEIGPLNVLPGSYRAVIPAFGFGTVFDVPETGLPDLALRVPAPAVLDIRLLDRDTNEELLHQHGLSWTWLGDPAAPSVRSTPDRGSGTHRCTVPVGSVRLVANIHGYAGEQHELVARRGAQPVTLSLRKHCGLEVQYRVGDSVLSLPWDQVPVRLTAIEGEGTVESTAATSDRQWIYTSEPGRYRLTLEPMDGFAPSPPRIVDIPPGTMLPVNLELERVR